METVERSQLTIAEAIGSKMKPIDRLSDGLAHLPRLRWSVRLRLTLLYGMLFLLSGTGLLAFTYVLVEHANDGVLVATGSDGSTAVINPNKTMTGPEKQASDAQPQLDMTLQGNDPKSSLTPAQIEAQAEQMRDLAIRQHASEMHQFALNSAISLGVMAIISVVLGWIVAGRVLRPLRTITATTQAISVSNLHERLALRGPDDEVKELGDTIDRLLARLEAAFNAQRRFVANASHELRTPLTMLRTSLDVAEAKPGPQPPEVGALVGKLREGLDQADRLLEGLLVLARAEHSGLGETACVSLPRLVEATLETQHASIAETNLSLRVTLDPAYVSGSETLLNRLVVNVLDNAIRHNEPGGFVHVITTMDRSTARLLVENGGPCFDAARIRQLGQPFQRLTADRTVSDGSVGLGLSIVRAIATAHGGSFDVHARPSGGLCVTISLPCVERRLEAA